MQQKVVKVSTRMNSCPLCSAKLVKKYNKNNRHIITLNGEFWVRERVLRCRNRECPGHALSFRAEDFQAAIIPYKIFGLDVILHIGTLRYEEHKTYEEIRAALDKKSIRISMGELTNLTMTFESLIKGWHEEHIQEIKQKLGEYILSIDGTYTYKGKTLYIFRSYENGVVLYANTTEKDDVSHVQPLLEKVVEMYGLPIAVISDMQPAIIEAVKNVLPGIPHQFCQYHFIKNAGNFMEKEYKELGKAMKKKEVRANAKEVEADLKKTPK
jgi:hypothetical protein|uniref:MULE transposase domain-containing protein n=1 Tax=Candidatus Methanophaga sp. ANME-1 ERB7 TaxID=2759913 RepID=A0A7G9Z550_9EURY|nr:hypothetical protein BNGNOALE_00010 [Methanosarcinales archaeon ANME-1 ERB7]